MFVQWKGLVKLITCNDAPGHRVDVWRSGTFFLYSCKRLSKTKERSPRLPLPDVERLVAPWSVFAIGSTLTYSRFFWECAIIARDQFTRPSPALVLQTTCWGEKVWVQDNSQSTWTNHIRQTHMPSKVAIQSFFVESVVQKCQPNIPLFSSVMWDCRNTYRGLNGNSRTTEVDLQQHWKFFRYPTRMCSRNTFSLAVIRWYRSKLDIHISILLQMYTDSQVFLGMDMYVHTVNTRLLFSSHTAWEQG